MAKKHHSGIPGCALRLVFSGALSGARDVTVSDQGSVAELDLLFQGSLLVLNETPLLEVLIALFFLLGLKVSGIGCVALLAVAVLASDDVIVLRLLHHDNLVNTLLTGGSDGPDVERNVITAALTSQSTRQNRP